MHPLRTAAEFARNDRLPEAIACLESALACTRADERSPANTSLLARTAGLFCEAAGQYSQAAAYYEEAAATDANDPLLWLALASVCHRLGQGERAHSCLARGEAMASASSDAEALQMVATIRSGWATDHG